MNNFEKCKLFAETYADELVLIPAHVSPGFYTFNSSDNRVARIIGYVANSDVLIVEYIEPSVQQYQWPINEQHSFVRLVNDAKWGWNVGYQLVELIVFKPTTKQNPYPNKCKSCSSPSRKIGNMTLCSNQKCKSNAKLKQKMRTWKRAPQIKMGDMEDNPIILKCPKCENPIISYGVFIDMLQAKRLSGVCCKKHLWIEYPFEIGKWYAINMEYKGLRFTGVKNTEWSST